MSTQPLPLYDPLLFLLIYLNHVRLHKRLSYRSNSLCFFYFNDIKIYIYVYTLLCVYILLLLSCFGFSQYILLLIIIPSSSYANHTIYSYESGHWIAQASWRATDWPSWDVALWVNDNIIKYTDPTMFEYFLMWWYITIPPLAGKISFLSCIIQWQDLGLVTFWVAVSSEISVLWSRSRLDDV